jgi:hypothetical protein
VVVSVDKTSWIAHIDVISPTFEGDDGDDVWWVRSQHHPNITYKIHALEEKHVFSTTLYD